MYAPKLIYYRIVINARAILHLNLHTLSLSTRAHVYTAMNKHSHHHTNKNSHKSNLIFNSTGVSNTCFRIIQWYTCRLACQYQETNKQSSQFILFIFIIIRRMLCKAFMWACVTCSITSTNPGCPAYVFKTSLENFASSIIDLGYDSVDELPKVESEDFETVCRLAELKIGHVAKLKRALNATHMTAKAPHSEASS
jgi:hypothetical protein